MVVLHSPAGWGKSTAAAYARNQLNGYYVECKETWTRRALLKNILVEMGIEPIGVTYEMAEAVCMQLAQSGRPLIIDEMDHLVNKSAVEIVRDLHDGSGAAILLVGEERLPRKLEKWERFHSRVLEWIAAQPADIDDAYHLANLYCGKDLIADDLLERIHSLSDGSARRICVNLQLIKAEAKAVGVETIDLAAWGDKQLYTGKAQARRI
jgi:hypothetical protein